MKYQKKMPKVVVEQTKYILERQLFKWLQSFTARFRNCTEKHNRPILCGGHKNATHFTIQPEHSSPIFPFVFITPQDACTVSLILSTFPNYLTWLNFQLKFKIQFFSHISHIILYVSNQCTGQNKSKTQAEEHLSGQGKQWIPRSEAFKGGFNFQKWINWRAHTVNNQHRKIYLSCTFQGHKAEEVQPIVIMQT